MPVTEKKKATNAKWDKENMRTVATRIRKEEAEAFARYAEERNTTANALLREYVRKCINEEPQSAFIITEE